MSKGISNCMISVATNLIGIRGTQSGVASSFDAPIQAKQRPMACNRSETWASQPSFDLRSTSEIDRTQDFAPTMNITGVRGVHVSLFDGEHPTHQTVESFKIYGHLDDNCS